MARIKIGNIKGPKGDIGPQGIQGVQGPAGPQGPLPPLANNGLTTEAGVAALDATYGKTLKDLLDQTNSNLDAINSKLTISTPNTSRIDVGTAGADGKTYISFVGTDESQVAVEYWPDKIQFVKCDPQTKIWSTIWSLPIK